MLHRKTFHSESELIEHIKTHAPSFYFSSQTSTVIPYDKIEEYIKDELYFCDVSKLPSKMELLENNNLLIRGPVTWQEVKNYLVSKGRNIKTSPTEELALVLAGIATSCTGERCFGYGNLRSQVARVNYINHEGTELTLLRDQPLESSQNLKEYAETFSPYAPFKNAPFPRFENQIDLMTGTEGQLGVITEAEIETAELFPVTYMFMLLPKWEEDYDTHLDIYERVQAYREDILSCELVDSNAFSYLAEAEKVNKDGDVIFLEVRTSSFDKIYDEILGKLNVSEDSIFEIPAKRFQDIRASIPRAVFEVNSKMGVVKMGTDAQVITKVNFQKLLDYYRECSKIGVKYNLFGHFGDAHLHFNFMPLPKDVGQCQGKLLELYKLLQGMKCSPFAEHGIGIIKQKFIQSFWQDIHYQAFKELKQEHDPQNQFFPQGFMNLIKK